MEHSIDAWLGDTEVTDDQREGREGREVGVSQGRCL